MKSGRNETPPQKILDTIRKVWYYNYRERERKLPTKVHKASEPSAEGLVGN